VGVDEEKCEPFAFVVGLGLGLLLAVICSLFLDDANDVRREAVRAGAAHYDVRDGEFRWGAP
jgi:hypothetical protein